jgi:hypothetical protein
MGFFSGRDQVDLNSQLESFISQPILAPKLFLSPVEGEHFIRVYGQPKYAQARTELIQRALLEKQPFWQAKVFLEAGEVSDEGSLPKKVYFIRAGESVIGELSEFDRRAQELLSFEEGSTYLARAVIQDDLIGSVVQLFVNPNNQA